MSIHTDWSNRASWRPQVKFDRQIQFQAETPQKACSYLCVILKDVPVSLTSPGHNDYYRAETQSSCVQEFRTTLSIPLKYVSWGPIRSPPHPLRNGVYFDQNRKQIKEEGRTKPTCLLFNASVQPYRSVFMPDQLPSSREPQDLQDVGWWRTTSPTGWFTCCYSFRINSDLIYSPGPRFSPGGARGRGTASGSGSNSNLNLFFLNSFFFGIKWGTLLASHCEQRWFWWVWVTSCQHQGQKVPLERSDLLLPKPEISLESRFCFSSSHFLWSTPIPQRSLFPTG